MTVKYLGVNEARKTLGAILAHQGIAQHEQIVMRRQVPAGSLALVQVLKKNQLYPFSKYN